MKLNLKIRKLLLKNWLFYFLFSLAIVIALIRISIPRHSIYNGSETNFVGIVKEIKYSNGNLNIVISTPEKIKATMYLNSVKELNYYKNNLKLGMKISISGTLNEPGENTVRNTFNYKKYLYYHDMFFTCKIDKLEIVETKVNFLYKVKNYVIDRINKFEDTKSYLLTFVIGDKSLMDNEELSGYRANGVTHLFAISGMHIGLFSGFLLFILKKIKLSENLSYICTVLFIWFYAFLTGFTPSVLRAGVLFTLLSFNKIFYLEIKSLNCLLFGGSILLFFYPFLLKDLGFLYSFITTFGLMYSSSMLKKHKILGTSLVAFLFSLPITINNFFEINFLSILINIIFVPLVSILIYPLCLLSFIFEFLEPIVSLSIALLTFLNRLFEKVNFLKLIIPKMNFIFIIVYYFCLLFLVNKKLKLCLFLLFLTLFVSNLVIKSHNSYFIEFLDVGQGDSALIRTPNNKNVILIDTGGMISYKTEEWRNKKPYYVSNNTISYLKSMGIKKITTMIFTHGDADHMGEAINLVENFKVEKVIFNCGKFNDLEKELIKVLDMKQIPYYSCINELNINDNKLYFLNKELYDNENDNSCVVYTEFNNHKFLFMGDAGVDVEEELIEKYNLQDIDVLKVGHHGSKTSTGKNFIDEINPKYSIISVGKNNRYGHPNSNVLDILKYSQIYRTDIDGSVMFEINKDKLEIETCTP